MDGKEVLAQEAMRYVRDVKFLGLGTGRTVRTLIKRLNKEGILSSIEVICSSVDTERQVAALGGNVLSIFVGKQPEIYIDSFDLLVERKTLVKGGGAALLREKLLAYYSQKRIYLGESHKLKDTPPVSVPVEVVPTSLSYLVKTLEQKGFNVLVRESEGKIGPVITDNGNAVIDVEVRDLKKLCDLDRDLKMYVGVVETGIFCPPLYDEILVAHGGEIERITKKI